MKQGIGTRIMFVVFLLAVALQRNVEGDSPIAPTDQTLLDKSAAIFVGRVVSTKPGSTIYQVEVLATWRGVNAGAIITVKTRASKSGFFPALGSTMLFFTSQDMETAGGAVDQDMQLPIAQNLAFLGPPKAEVSDKTLAACPCDSAPIAGRKSDVELRAGKPVADGRYAVWIPITAKFRPNARFKYAPTSIMSPAGGCQLRIPAGSFWFATSALTETALANRCIADQLRVRK